MSKFNQKTNTINKTINKAGGEAYVADPKFELISILLTSFVKEQYYRNDDESVEDVTNIIKKIKDKKFIGKSAIYARTKFGTRSISHIVAGEIAQQVKGETWTKDFFDKIIYRPDDMAEILAYYSSKNGKRPIPKAIKKGFSKAISRFDEYQIAKYKKEKSDYSLIDIVNLIHPKPTEAINKLMKGTLKPANTWETKLSETGKAETEDEKEKLKKKAWKDLIETNKIGYFALLRNLRNIIEQAPEMTEKACEMLTDKKLIKNSLVLPFRFMTAIHQIENNTSAEDNKNINAILVALNKALEISMDNIPVFDGKTLVVVDHSGSMDSVEHGNMTNFEIGALFAIAFAKKNNSDFMYFADYAKYKNINPLDTTTTLVKNLNDSGSEVGWGTNFHSIFEEAKNAYDRIVIFSDMQGWVGYDSPQKSLVKYKKRTGANPKVYSIDLAGYGTLQFPKENIYALAGFSEKIFDLMKLLEQDRQALVNEIEKISI